MAFSNTDYACKLLSQCQGRKILIPGNHDKKNLKSSNFRSHWFKITSTLIEIEVKDYHLVLCHYPLESWNHMFHGSIHCHGHCHSSRQKGLKPSIKQNRLDVGVDYHQLSPISLDAVLLEIESVNKQVNEKSIDLLF